MRVAVVALAACADEPSVTHLEVERTTPVVVSQADAVVDSDSAAVDSDSAAVDCDSAAVDSDSAAVDSDVAVDSDLAAGPITTFPVTLAGDTSTSPRATTDRYDCAPDTDESGPEIAYLVRIEHLGILRASLDDVAGDGVDVDVHLLDPEGRCVRRDNVALAWVVRPGDWTVVVDSWVGGDGVARAGAFRLTLEHLPLDAGRCALADQEQRMFWGACTTTPNATLDCRDDGAMRWLRTPSLGPVVGEAHLVTVDEDFTGDGWPTALRDQIERHYQISQAATGYVMDRDEPWAPEGEGGSHWGGGATGQKLPVLDEAWYVNMYWRDRPARGRRVLVIEPWSGRAVVAAGGWETGPGSNTAIGGACEEIHHALASSHRDDLVMGFLVDDALPLGPIDCW